MNNSNQVTVFNFEANDIRTTTINNEPWFVAKDIAEALGYTNSAKALADHCKGVTKRYLLTNGGTQSISLIKESDVYRLIMRSKLPRAECFQDWVCEEVLPAIRKAGSYQAVPQTYSEALQLAANQAAELEIQSKALEATKPKVELYDKLVNLDTSYTIGNAAKLIGFKRQMDFRESLKSNKYLLSNGQPSQKAVSSGYLTNKVYATEKFSNSTAMITFKGLEYFTKVFHSRDAFRPLLTSETVKSLPPIKEGSF